MAMTESSPDRDVAEVETLSIPFQVPNRSQAHVQVSVSVDTDPKRHGIDLLFPSATLSDYLGYPACTARITSSPHSQGYASIYGWVQVFREGIDATAASRATWGFDSIPIYESLETPFCWFGPDPTLFDAPSRPGVQDVDWTARSFLTYLDDSLLSRTVKPILAFEWGFRIEDGKKSVKPLKRLSLDAWDEQLKLLATKFPNWQFKPLQ